ncbi:MAG: methyltransferase domain-containing protein [Candidatus Roizmanbacteria bacterium]|nr:MAG: methyltransferase domain-containing protein [Candidatus Roizmanbacteria bacterium]
MGKENEEIIASANQRAGLNEPQELPVLGSNAKALIEKIITLNPKNPDYPFSQPFDKHYAGMVSDDPGVYARKYTLARALIADGRYGNIRFLDTAFIPQGEEVPPQVQALKDDLHVRVREELLKRGDKKVTAEVEEDMRNFTQEVDEGKTLDAQEFRKLVHLFGGSRVVDILYRTRPEFRGMPVEKVKSIIADFLGDFLVKKGGFNPDDIEVGIKYLSEATFQEGLYETIKDNCLQFYNFQKKAGSAESDRELTNEYFDIADMEIQGFKNPHLDQILQRARQYYTSLYEDLPKPPQIIGELKEGRSFPDLNQLINMKEVVDKRRVAIADDMGLGKSASMILTKEMLHLKCALVAAPANVISTWQRYLSDQKVDGKQMGYFKEGMAPKVVIIDNPLALHESDFSQADYVLISHERLNDSYTPVLEQVPFEMVIVDEVHKLKNLQKGVRAGNLIKIAQAAERRNAYLGILSGTPVPNKIQDVAMILKLLYPERFGEASNKDLVKKIINGDLLDLRSLLIPRMQMKGKESLNLPELTQDVIKVDMSPEEKEVYEVLMENDEMEATEKIQVLRQFLMNPKLLDMTPNMEGSKIKAVGQHLNNVFQNKNKVVMFVNGYVQGIIRGDKEKIILGRMGLPDDVEIKVIHGEDMGNIERERIQSEFNNSDKKILLVVSGQTADVGIDLSGGEEVVFYNEPWSLYDKQQQLARVHREGVKHPVRSMTFITNGTIEDGISIYIQMKQNAIEKLLRGIELSKMDKELLEKDEKVEGSNLEVNRELADYYFSSLDRMMKIFGHVRELGEEAFIKFLERYGEDYAECYSDLGSRNYQSNACRINGTIIAEMIEKHGQDLVGLRILDIASGPEMLRKHITDKYQDRIISLDINALHFKGEGGNRIVGSFTALPVESGSIDYANLSLALHYSRFVPSKGEYERLKVLAEMNRVLKIGGKTVLNLMYNADLKSFEKFKTIVEALGFKIDEEYTDNVIVGTQYQSRIITLEKIQDIDPDINVVISNIDKEAYDGLKMPKGSCGLKNPRKIVRAFVVNGVNHPVKFNDSDQAVLEEETTIMTEGEQLRNMYGGVKYIPRDDIIQNGYARVLIANKYVLFKKLQNNNGVVIIR